MDEGEEQVLYPHEDVLVIKDTVASKKFDWILMDIRSLVDVLFKSTLDEIRITDMRLEHTNTFLKGFSRWRLILLGMVKLPITIGFASFEKTMILNFIIIDKDSPYQMILGWPFLKMSKAVISNHYFILTYRMNRVVGVVRGD